MRNSIIKCSTQMTCSYTTAQIRHVLNTPTGWEALQTPHSQLAGILQ